MRALFVLCALCLATSLQAADIAAESPAEADCIGSSLAIEANRDEAAAGGVDTLPPSTAAPARRSPSVSDRSRMSSRWHSLLPGMFR